MGNDTTRLGNNLIEQLDTDKLLNADLGNNQSSDFSNILNRNSLFNQSFGWIGTSPEEVEASLNAPRCDCLYCCGISSSDFVATNNLNNLATDTSPFAAASSVSGSVPNSGNNKIDALLTSRKWTSNTITYSFFDGGSYYGNERNVRPITEKMKNDLRGILETIENYIDVDFVEVSDAGNNYGQLRYMFSDMSGSAYGYYPSNSAIGGDVHFNPNLTQDFEAGPGSFRYTTLIHETLHTIGLKHPGDYNGNGAGDPPFLPAGEDNGANSVMSYNRFQNRNDLTDGITPMSYDIRALQYMYGAADNNGGNTTYKFSDIDGYTVGGKFFGGTNRGVKQTLWDSGGKDTLDFSQLASNNSGYRFDLQEGGVITTQSAYNATPYDARGDNSNKTYYATGRGTFLSYDMTIENVVNSSSDDYIVANQGANTFSGYSKSTSTGDDVIVGSNGQDTLDLSDYTVSDFTTRNSSNDLIIDLKGNGSIRVDDYYTAAQSDRLKLKTAGDNPIPPDPNPTNQSLVWEEQNLRDESAVATGTKFNLANGLTATINWQVITDGGDFVAYGGEDYVSYESGITGNHAGYLSLGFNNSNDDPDDLIKLDLNFNQAVTGLSFKLLDVDQYDGKAFDDGVEIYADGVNIKKLSGVEIVTGSNVMADNERYMKGFEGRGNTGVDNNSEEGNIEISFGSTEVSSLEIKYFSTDDAIANPDSQKIGISDLDFQVKST